MLDRVCSVPSEGAVLSRAGKPMLDLMTISRVVIIGLGVLLLGCASDDGARPINVEAQQPHVFSAKQEPLPELGLAPWDSFSLVLYKRTGTQPEINLSNVRVDSKGEVVLPLIGKVQVANLTIQQLESKLYRLYNREFVDPHVQVLPGESRNRNVYVLGEVESPGIFPLRTSVPVIELILMAGGFTTDANRANIVLVRPVGANGPSIQGSIASADMTQFLNNARFVQNVQVRPGDVVYVPPDSIARRDRLFKHILTVMQPFIQTVEAISSIFIVTGVAGQE